jgi:hypothetical protein
MLSQQMINLMARYGVETESELCRAIAADLTEECCDPGDEPFRAKDMGAVLDQMLEAEYQRIAGGAYDVATCDLCGLSAAHIHPDEEYWMTGWNDELAAAERRAEEQAFWEGL